MEIKHILALISIVLFVSLFLIIKSPRRSYILFLLLLLPFIDLNVTREEFGSVSVFDFITYFVFFFTFEDFFYFSKKNNFYYPVFLVLTGVLFIGSIKSEFMLNSLINYLKYFSIFIYSKILIDECLKDESFIQLVLKFLKLSCILSLAFLVVQFIIGTNFTFYPDLNPNTYLDLESGASRYPSFFQDPQKYAQYLSMLGFLFLMNKKSSTSPGIKNIFIFSFIILALLLTGGRAAFIGLALGLLIVLIFRKGKYWLVFMTVSLTVYLISIKYQEYFSILNRTDDLKSSFEVRNDIWNENLQIFLEKPLLGIGIGNHHNYIVNHSAGGYYLIDNEIVYYGTESGYLQILIEYGILGFILVFLLIMTPVINSIKSYRNTHNSNIILLVASVISWLAAFVTINSLSDRRILVILATLLCLLIISKTSSESIHA